VKETFGKKVPPKNPKPTPPPTPNPSGGLWVDPPAPTATPTPKAPKRNPDDWLKNFFEDFGKGVSNTLAPVAADPNGRVVLNFGKGVIDALETPAYFFAGANQQSYKDSKREASGQVVSKNPSIYSQLGIYTPEQFAAGAENVRKAWAGEEVIFGGEANKLREELQTGKPYEPFMVGGVDLKSLLYDFGTDPTTYVGGKFITIPLQAAVKGGSNAIKFGKLAHAGEVSARVAVKSEIAAGKAAAEAAGKTLDKDAIRALKEAAEKKLLAETPNKTSRLVNQYGGRVLIKENLLRDAGLLGDVTKKLETIIADKFTYRTIPAFTTLNGTPKVNEIVANAIEAGLKAAGATVVAKIARTELQSLARFETKLAKRADKAAKKAGEEVVDIIVNAPKVMTENGVRDMEPFAPHTSPEGTFVMDDKSIIRQFKTKKEANSWIKEQGGASPIAKPGTKGSRPIIDSQPVVTSTEAIKNASAKGDKSLQSMQTMVKNVETLVGKAKGVSSGGNALLDNVRNVLREATTVKSAVRTLNADIKTGIKNVLNGTKSPLSILREWQAAGGQFKSVADELGKKTVVLKNGETIELAKLAGQDFTKASAQLKTQILQHFKDFVSAGTAGEAEFIAKLSALVGKDVAEKIAATGVLAGKTDAKSVNELKAILDTLAQNADGVEKTYKNYGELVAGLRNGDIISTDVLTKILKAIDPDNAIVTRVDKALSKTEAHARIRSILTSPTTVMTVQTAANSIRLMDAQNIFKTEGMSFPELAATYAESRLRNELSPAEQFFEQSRQAAAARITDKMNNPQYSDDVEITLRSIARGFDSQFEYVEEISQSEDFWSGLSSIGDMVSRTTEKAFQTNAKAAIIEKLTQHGDARIVGNLFGLNRRRVKTSNPEELMEKFIDNGEIMNDSLLSVMGARVMVQKPVIKGVKADKHFIFFSTPDFVRIMRDTGMPELVQKAMFPNTNKVTIIGKDAYEILKTDSLSTIGVNEAVRGILEAFEKGVAIDKKWVIKQLMSRGDLQTPWSKGFQAQLPQIAAEIAEHITKPKVIAEFQKVHTTRAGAAVDDLIDGAEAINKDMLRAMAQGRLANLGKGLDDPSSRAQLVRNWYNEFVYSSGVFNQQSGPIAQAMLQASAKIFLVDGKLAKLVADEPGYRSLIGSATSTDEIGQKIAAEMFEGINSFFKYTGSDAYAGVGREHLPFPTPATIAKATDKLTAAQALYKKLIDDWENVTTAAGEKQWNIKFAKAQKMLDEARDVAWKNSVPTFHWLDGEGWVLSENYNHATAKAAASTKTVILGTGGAISKKTIVDNPAKFPSMKKMTAAQSKKWLEKFREENNIRSLNAIEGVSEEAAQRTIDKLPEIEGLGLHPTEELDLINQTYIADIIHDADIISTVGPINYGYKGAFEQFINEGDIAATRTKLERVAERLNATSGRQNLRPLVMKAETTAINRTTNTAKLATLIRDKYKGLVDYEDFGPVWKLVVSRSPMGPEVPKAVQALVRDLQRMLDPIFGNPQTSAITRLNLDPAHLTKTFSMYLGKVPGVPDASTFTTSKDFINFLQHIPFDEMPEALKKIGNPKQWEVDRADFKRANVDPFVLLTRTVQAVQMAATEKQFVMDFVRQFNYEARGLSFAEAVKAKWVRIKGKGSSGTDLSIHIPSPEKGGLFPPEIAKEFISINREWNKIQQNGNMPAFIRTTMEAVGFLKVFQTIFRLGHHPMNMWGDTTAALTAGATPLDFAQGLAIAKMFWTEDFKTTWGKNKLEEQFNKSFGVNNFDGRTFEGTATNSFKVIPPVAITLVKNGKPVKIDLANEDLFPAFKEDGAVVGNVFQNDIPGFYDSVIADRGVSPLRKNMYQRAVAKTRLIAGKIEEPAGAFASYYSNIPRAAHAIHVIQSRSWNSVEEALAAARDSVSRYHPTVSSLSGTDRRIGRIAITYYTWLRVSHNALIDMFVDHTAAMLVPYKVQYEQKKAQGLDPRSVGDPWSVESRKTVPGYLRNKLTGPTKDANGDINVYKSGIQSLDVLNTWNFNYDNFYTPDQNFYENLNSLGLTLFGAANQVLQKPYEVLSGINPQTGAPTKITDNETFSDSLMRMWGTTNLLRGVGLYDYSNEKPGTPKALTAEDRKRILDNWLTGQGKQEVYNNANRKNAGQEEVAANKNRLKKILENLRKGK
jgi:hypothetical protein